MESNFFVNGVLGESTSEGQGRSNLVKQEPGDGIHNQTGLGLQGGSNLVKQEPTDEGDGIHNQTGLDLPFQHKGEQLNHEETESCGYQYIGARNCLIGLKAGRCSSIGCSGGQECDISVKTCGASNPHDVTNRKILNNEDQSEKIVKEYIKDLYVKQDNDHSDFGKTHSFKLEQLTDTNFVKIKSESVSHNEDYGSHMEDYGSQKMVVKSRINNGDRFEELMTESHDFVKKDKYFEEHIDETKAFESKNDSDVRVKMEPMPDSEDLGTELKFNTETNSGTNQIPWDTATKLCVTNALQHVQSEGPDFVKVKAEPVSDSDDLDVVHNIEANDGTSLSAAVTKSSLVKHIKEDMEAMHNTARCITSTEMSDAVSASPGSFPIVDCDPMLNAGTALDDSLFVTSVVPNIHLQQSTSNPGPPGAETGNMEVEQSQGQLTVCPIENCGKTYRTRRGFRMHKRSHEKKFSLQCELCDRGFFNRRDYDGHMNRHFNKRPYKCTKCDKQFGAEQVLSAHKKWCGSNIPRTNFCRHCMKAFSTEEELLSHKASLDRFQCSLCDSSFTRTTTLRRHVRTIHENKFFICPDCGRKCADAFRLKSHVCPGKDPTPSRLGAKTKLHDICAKLVKNFNQPLGLGEGLLSDAGLQHIVGLSSDAGLGEGLSSHTRLGVGLSSDADLPNSEPFLVQPIQETDSENFKMNFGALPLMCKYCDKTFTATTTLEIHERFCIDEKPTKMFRCQMCDKTFERKCNFTRHKCSLVEERPHKCKLCEKTFVRPSHLACHELIHTGIKPYKCKYCEKSFTEKPNLSRHEQIHTGEKPFECKSCFKVFTQKCHLIRHQRIHTSERPFECKHCGKAFVQESHLVRHELIHTGEKPYQCKHCLKRFTQNSSLTRHEQLHNQNNDGIVTTGKGKHSGDQPIHFFESQDATPMDLTLTESNLLNNDEQESEPSNFVLSCTDKTSL